MRTAWDRAFKALSARLSLAQRKTNTVHQRAKLASAIIIPKLLYEGRHAWPSQDVVTEADNRIKNFIWRSSFARTDRAPAGWVGAAIAGLPDNLGGVGIPCIKTELMALGAHTVGKWALAENPLTQMIGDILQLPHGLQKRALVPRHCKIPCKLRKSIWETGRPWTGLHWAQDNSHDEEQEGRRTQLQLQLEAERTVPGPEEEENSEQRQFLLSGRPRAPSTGNTAPDSNRRPGVMGDQRKPPSTADGRQSGRSTERALRRLRQYPLPAHQVAFAQ
ncbi:hypothetical protein PC129_g13336 [Phytophthora cactorum]|uniref:Uncharacterized protein n=1 Tax=Phytophthora cactorum TaxID=29920 RepID=A0A8T1HSH2_9STRA|nr:hypothetical protein PC129_g13336 [Phytophthora cactorum]